MAGIGSADMNGAGMNGLEGGHATGGLLSPLARAQYAALAGLRWRTFVNGLRSHLGVFELGARTVFYLLYSMMGLGLGAAMGAFTYQLAYRHKWQLFPILFWVTCLIWQIVPIMLASFQEQFDLGNLLRFPVGFRSFFLLYVVFGLLDVSTILGGLCCAGIWIGVTTAQPELFAWTALALTIFAAFNILLVRAIFAWIDRWLAQRRTREILAALFMVFVLSIQLLNPTVWRPSRRVQGRSRNRQQIQQLLDEPWVKTANEVQEWLPPGLPGVVLRQAAEDQSVPALGSLGVLALFVLGAGGVLGLRLRAEYRGENLGATPALKKAAATPDKAISSRERAAGRESAWHLSGSGPVAAIMRKEMHSLVRTLPLLYAVGAPLVGILVISGAFIRGAKQAHTPLMAFPLCVFFAQMGFIRLFSNSLGTEGPGIKLYFLSPTPIRTVMLAKNLFHTLAFALTLAIGGILAVLRLGRPDRVVVAATIAWLLFVLPCNLGAGNILSLTMPYRVNPGRVSRQLGSQASVLLSLLFECGALGAGAVVFALCSSFGTMWLTVPIFLALAGVAVFVWLRILGNSDRIANQRKDLLIATLVKTE
jgi:ABC-2 type transport system permease protein